MKTTSSWIYENDDANLHRYLLGESGSHMLACFGLNPSTASPARLDQTLKSVKRISKYNGFDGWVMYNLYPKRATNPALLPIRCSKQEHAKNCEIILQSLKLLNIKTIWLAYGNLVESRTYLRSCGSDIFQSLLPLNLQWKAISRPTRKGHPRHPLYQSTRSVLSTLDPNTFFKDLTL